MSMLGGIVSGIVGGMVGLGALNVMALIAKNSGKPCDTVQFGREGSIWPDVDDWARRYGYVLKQDNGNSRRYQKGKNILTAPVMVDVTQEGAVCTIKAYIQINGFIVKGDMALSSLGFMAKIPRATGKKEVNVLFKEMGQPEIA